MVSLCRWVSHLLALLLGMGGPDGRWCRHPCGANERMVCGGAEYPLTHICRITQNRTGGHLTGQATDCAGILRQVEGDRGRGLIVIRGRKEFLLLYGHELAFDLALYASLACLAGGIRRGALKRSDVWLARAAEFGREKAYFHLTTAALGTGHEGPAVAAPGRSLGSGGWKPRMSARWRREAKEDRPPELSGEEELVR